MVEGHGNSGSPAEVTGAGNGGIAKSRLANFYKVEFSLCHKTALCNKFCKLNARQANSFIMFCTSCRKSSSVHTQKFMGSLGRSLSVTQIIWDDRFRFCL